MIRDTWLWRCWRNDDCQQVTSTGVEEKLSQQSPTVLAGRFVLAWLQRLESYSSTSPTYSQFGNLSSRISLCTYNSLPYHGSTPSRPRLNDSNSPLHAPLNNLLLLSSPSQSSSPHQPVPTSPKANPILVKHEILYIPSESDSFSPLSSATQHLHFSTRTF